MDDSAPPGPCPEDDPAAYERWFRAKVERARAGTAPTIAHDDVIRDMRDALRQGDRAPARLGR